MAGNAAYFNIYLYTDVWAGNDCISYLIQLWMSSGFTHLSLSLCELTLWLTANVKIQVLSLSCYSKINIAKIIAILLWWSHPGFPRWSVSLPKPHCIKALELVPPVLSLICQPDNWGYYTPHHHHPPLSCWFTQSVDESLHSCNLIIIIL